MELTNALLKENQRTKRLIFYDYRMFMKEKKYKDSIDDGLVADISVDYHFCSNPSSAIKSPDPY